MEKNFEKIQFTRAIFSQNDYYNCKKKDRYAIVTKDGHAINFDKVPFGEQKRREIAYLLAIGRAAYSMYYGYPDPELAKMNFINYVYPILEDFEKMLQSSIRDNQMIITGENRTCLQEKHFGREFATGVLEELFQPHTLKALVEYLEPNMTLDADLEKGPNAKTLSKINILSRGTRYADIHLTLTPASQME